MGPKGRDDLLWSQPIGRYGQILGGRDQSARASWNFPGSVMTVAAGESSSISRNHGENHVRDISFPLGSSWALAARRPQPAARRPQPAL